MSADRGSGSLRHGPRDATERVELEAWQAIHVPRHWDDPERELDEPTDLQLDRMLARVRKGLDVWTELLDQLTPPVARA